MLLAGTEFDGYFDVVWEFKLFLHHRMEMMLWGPFY